MENQSERPSTYITCSIYPSYRARLIAVADKARVPISHVVRKCLEVGLPVAERALARKEEQTR